MKKTFFVVAAVTTSSLLQAQQDSTIKSMDEIVLTSSKYPQKQTETGKVMTVINRQELEKNIGRSLGEVLNTAVGTTIIGANNVAGTNTTVSIRGASAGNVLILLDGVPVNDPSVITNYFDLNLISIDQIERVEILKGGQSTLYGSDAVAGVINIISRKSGNKAIELNGNLTAGSYNTFKQYAGISGRKNHFNYSVNYTHLSSDGFSAAYDKDGNKDFDNDGINQHATQARLGFDLSHRLHATITGSYNYYKTDLDAGAFTDDNDYTVKNKNGQAGAGLVYDHKTGSLHFNYLFNYVERDYLNDSADRSSPYAYFSKSNYIGRTHYAELYNNWKWSSSWELLTGIDYRFNNTNQEYFSLGSFSPYEAPVLNKKMSQVSPYASLLYKDLSGFHFELGGRWNHHSEYGNNFTFNLNPSYLIRNKAKVFANFYTAFKAPTLYQLFDPSAGNIDLQPEKGWIGEAGAELFCSSSFRTRVVGFYRNTKNAIIYTSTFTPPFTYTSQYRNANKQLNYGLEFEATYTKGKVNITGNYTFTDGETTSSYDGTGAPIGKDTTYYNLYRIPKHAINLMVGVQATKALYLRVQSHTVTDREEFVYGAAPDKLDGYTTIDFYGEYKFSPTFRAFLDLKNITNKEYFDIMGYNSREFNVTGGVSFRL